MRTLLVPLALALAATLASPAARADGGASKWRTGTVTGPHTALEIALVDQWRSAHARPLFQSGANAAHASGDQDPAAEVGSYVERLWSQVRAYRRPGGAEVLVRTKF